jgi:hypothetical protein
VIGLLCIGKADSRMVILVRAMQNYLYGPCKKMNIVEQRKKKLTHFQSCMYITIVIYHKFILYARRNNTVFFRNFPNTDCIKNSILTKGKTRKKKGAVWSLLSFYMGFISKRCGEISIQCSTFSFYFWSREIEMQL